MKNKKIIFILALSLTSNYGFIITKGIFYNIIKSALQLSDVQLGYIWAVYGIVSMFGFPIGGFLADFLKSKQMACFATGMTAVLHLILATTPSYPVVMGIAALLGVTTIFIYYPATTKMIVSMYQDDSAGTAMGTYYALDGIYMFLVNMGFSLIYRVNGDAAGVFRGIMVTFALLGIVAFWLTVRYVPEVEQQRAIAEQSVEKARQHKSAVLVEIMKRPETWLISGIVISGYTLFSFSTYVTPYLSEIWHISEKDNLILAVVRGNVLNVAAGLAFGRWCARWKSGIKTMWAAFVVVAIFPLLSIWNQRIQQVAVLEILLTFACVFLVLGIKAISMSAMTEVQYPTEITGRVVGIVSLIGFSPDVWFYPIAGGMVERYGAAAYEKMTWLALIPIVVGIGCTWRLCRGALHKQVNET